MPADADAVTALVNQAYGHYVDRIGREPKPMTVDYRSAIAEHQLWVLGQVDNLTAVLELIAQQDALLIENIAVSPSHQGRGLASSLMAFAEKQALEQGFREIELYTNEHFVENLVFYAKHGYVETHRTPFKGSDTVYLKKRTQQY